MKQDYLWDKTGEDAEIAELENALAAFRYQETAPPALPSKILSFQPKMIEKKVASTPRRFSFALAACAAAILIAFGVLFQFLGGKNAVKNDLAQALSTSRQTADLPAENEALPLEKVGTPPQIKISKQTSKQIEKTPAISKARSNANKARQSEGKVSGAGKTFARKAAAEDSAVALTAEEKNAYDQLMLALSVTSRQLKIVKDKLNNTEENNSGFERSR